MSLNLPRFDKLRWMNLAAEKPANCHLTSMTSLPLQAGRIELVLGPMFAGKTTEMLRRLDRAELARRRWCVMKYSKDTRYSQDKVSTHDFQMRTAIPCAQLLPCLPTCMQFDVIGVDEGQFFPDVVEFAEHLANHGKTVIVAGLDGDFRRKPFGHILELISRCESITKLSAVCTETGDEAPFSQRTTAAKDIEVIGGQEMYRAASRSSFFHKPTHGELHLTIGPVRSGKTTELMRVLNRHQIAGRKPLLLRHTAVPELKATAKYEVRVVEELPPAEECAEFDIIGVDDGHMFDGIPEWADELANSGKLVEVSALDSNGEQEPFRSVIELFPLCEKVQKLEAVCPVTGLPAPFTAAVVGSVAGMMPLSRKALLANADAAVLAARVDH